MNNKGWMKIAEAFISILLIIGVLLIVVNQDIQKKDISLQIYEIEVAILREIQLNDSLRNEILRTTPPIEVTEENLPQTWSKITERTPAYLECKSKICETEDICSLGGLPKKNIYAQIITISSELEEEETYYVQLKLFCWLK